MGWGSVSPLGCDAESTWNGVLAGRSGITALREDWSNDLPVRISGCVPDAATGSLGPLLLRRSDRCAQLGLLAAREAWAMATTAIAGINPARVAVVLGTGIGGLHTMHEQHNQLTAGGPTRVNPLTVPMLIPMRRPDRWRSTLAYMVGRTPSLSLRIRSRSHDAGPDAAQRWAG